MGVVSGGGPELQGQLQVMGVMRVDITNLGMRAWVETKTVSDTER